MFWLLPGEESMFMSVCFSGFYNLIKKERCFSWFWESVACAIMQ